MSGANAGNWIARRNRELVNRKIDISLKVTIWNYDKLLVSKTGCRDGLYLLGGVTNPADVFSKYSRSPHVETKTSYYQPEIDAVPVLPSGLVLSRL